MTIKIQGRIPSKKNSRQQIRVGGRTINIPSKQYAEWHEQASLQIASKRPKLPLEDAHIQITIYAPDRRPADLSNKCEGVMDLLVDCGFLKDDNWFVVPRVTLVFGGVDKLSPRAEVSIVSPSHMD